jgi:hypothetical protein
MSSSPVSSNLTGSIHLAGQESIPENKKGLKSWTTVEKIAVIALNAIATTIFCIIFPLKGALLISANFMIGSLILRSVIKNFFCCKEAPVKDESLRADLGKRDISHERPIFHSSTFPHPAIPLRPRFLERSKSSAIHKGAIPQRAQIGSRNTPLQSEPPTVPEQLGLDEILSESFPDRACIISIAKDRSSPQVCRPQLACVTNITEYRTSIQPSVATQASPFHRGEEDEVSSGAFLYSSPVNERSSLGARSPSDSKLDDSYEVTRPLLSSIQTRDSLTSPASPELHDGEKAPVALPERSEIGARGRRKSE